MSPSSKDKLWFIGLKIISGTIILFIYIFAWRPLRVGITTQVVYPQVQSIHSAGDPYQASLKTGSLYIKYHYSKSDKELYYRPEFGFFFLVSVLSLLFVTTARKYYYLLFALHLISSVLCYLFLLLGAYGVISGFIIVDIISGYLTPALSLALVPLVIKMESTQIEISE